MINKILQETEVGYDMMSQKFSETRKFFWRGLEFIGDYAKDGDKILDFGCGNGRLLELFNQKNIEYFGVDVSQKLIDSAKNKYAGSNITFSKINPSPRTKAKNEKSDDLENLEPVKKVYLNQDDSQRLVRGRQNSLAFTDNFFNSAYSIAVFHHFPKEHAEKMAQELHRIIKSEGYIVITVWYLWQKNYIKNILKNWIGKLMGERELDWNDCYVSFKNNEGKIFQRYHHAYTKKELKKIFSKAGFAIEKCEVMNKRNIVLIGKK